MLRSIMALSLLAVPLAACDEKEGTTITLNADDSDGNVVAGVDGKSGAFSIKTPGFSGQITLPKIHLDGGNFEMNGVHLYPGSKISSMNIDARDGDGGDKKGSVRVTFESPATPDTVRTWFAEKLGGADFKLTQQGSGLVGTDDEGKPFKLDLTAAGDGKSNGVITAGH